MTSPANVVNVATGQIGYEETGGSSGHNGNVTKYWGELDPALQDQPWCAAFVSWVFAHAGMPLPAVDHSWGFSFCPDAVTYARRHGQLVPVGQARAGDVVFFNFSGGSLAVHVGIVVDNTGATLHTIEGNTEPSEGGDQANGGGVYRKNRPYSLVVAVWRPHYTDNAPAHHTQPARPNPFPAPTALVQQGNKDARGAKADPKHPNTTKVHFVQWAVGVPVDGDFGSDTLAGVEHFQHYHALTVDGVVGPHTLAALKRVKH